MAFSEYATNSVLFQRGLYPPESFKAEQQYGITLLMSEDPQIKSFLTNILGKSEGKLLFKVVRRYQNILNWNSEYFVNHVPLSIAFLTVSYC